MLTLPAIILIVLGALLAAVGGVWGIVVAFRRSLIWGLCYIFVPFASLAFLIVAWADAKRPFLVRMMGVFLILSVLLLPNQGGLGLKKLAAINLQQFEGFSPAVPGAVIQATPESRLAELTARETSLRARKAALDPNDLATAQALSDEILKYNADLKAVTDVQPPSQSGGASVVSYNSGQK